MVKKIKEERLELIPYTDLCVECSEQNISLDRKRELRLEEDSYRLYSGKHREGIQFDREDSYQEVARYNKIEKDPSFSTGDDIGVYDEENSGNSRRKLKRYLKNIMMKLTKRMSNKYALI